ncbi:hypothetical protein [Parafrankia sp. EUN1f]|uniref:hypothetical protein n=1 Tax=Parafrankia sp. EUN1f TaxID=102897 RepID=UPI0001C45FE3|nr:hypothetical protein [Parafrankia sp. EUN1f]EFC81311.1 hypothetical protein FrEUN1fDRAFT_5558 [Parafrankia sp. EUN1f]
MTACWAVATAGPGSAGATTLALALAYATRGVAIEANPDGGVLAARIGLSLGTSAPGLDTLVAELGTAAATGFVLDHAQWCASGLPVVACASTEETAGGAVRSLGALMPALRLLTVELFVTLDVGRYREGASESLVSGCDGLVLVTSAATEGLACALVRLPAVLATVPRLVLAVRGSGPYPLREIVRVARERAGVDVPVVAIPDDPQGAAGLIRPARRRPRRPSPLLRSMWALLDEVALLGPVPAGATAPAAGAAAPPGPTGADADAAQRPGATG